MRKTSKIKKFSRLFYKIISFRNNLLKSEEYHWMEFNLWVMWFAQNGHRRWLYRHHCDTFLDAHFVVSLSPRRFLEKLHAHFRCLPILINHWNIHAAVDHQLNGPFSLAIQVPIVCAADVPNLPAFHRVTAALHSHSNIASRIEPGMTANEFPLIHFKLIWADECGDNYLNIYHLGYGRREYHANHCHCWMFCVKAMLI